ncbi:vacuolar protein sorting 55 [Thamnocephalis sphaerospora]|uniref:Vacuolar protein sorting 55 n=1 Tax=Thamnocephalis sphaerospora TaxID=78915 RepID=A0A4P9XKR1_9FUNG|nr:vacuolar protein sorting 55 [Thamnocephalis sphaerospora]RKP06403.1 vacuolar protein sorting 55 [Thamnocephalis sphaerospora]|eukprot:RKP05376.1 vacuolar protein sorting 55 [Thamnocephalis sphaerospora]
MAGVKTIIALAFCLACGFLLIILSCALYQNWWPVLVAVTYGLAPLPNMLCARCGYSEDIFTDTQTGFADAGYFLTAVLVVTGLAMPVVLAHAGVIGAAAMAQSVTGGLLVYGTIVAYNHFFGQDDEY